MSAPKEGFTQDLPPKGGYAPFQITRTKLRTLFTGITYNLYRSLSNILFLCNVFLVIC